MYGGFIFLFVVSGACSAILLAFIAKAARQPSGVGAICQTATKATLFFGLCLSPLIGLQALLTLVFGLICLAVGAKPQTAFRGSIVAMLLVYGAAIVYGIIEVREYRQLRQEYPITSVAGRLSYENKQSPSPNPDDIVPHVSMNHEVATSLAQFEGRGYWKSRASMLRSLHESSAEEFIMASGFGLGRMTPMMIGRVNRKFIDLPVDEPVSLPTVPQPEYDANESEISSTQPLEESPQNPFDQRQLSSMHTAGLEDFLDPDRIGYVADRRMVAGFESHRLLKVPKSRAAYDEWQIVRLELVSLLKHDTPRIYVSRHLPKMDELKNVPTRALDPFEQHALPQLQTEQDIVVDEHPGRIRMLGSIRAGSDCLKCHSVERGELLGAFSYELVPVRPVKRQAEPISPQT